MDVVPGEEALTLGEVLASQNKAVTELELWALCKECALTLEYIQGQPDVCQGLYVTPDTVAFDQSGNVCFLDFENEPDPFFVPPEHRNGETSYKSQLFSLGMTMLYALDCNDHTKPELSEKLTDLLSHLTADDITCRPDLDTVISECETQLDSQSSQDICLRMSTIVPSPCPHEDSNSSILDLTSGLTAYLQSQSGIVSPTKTPDSLSPTAEISEPKMSHQQRTQDLSDIGHFDQNLYLDDNQNVKYLDKKGPSPKESPELSYQAPRSFTSVDKTSTKSDHWTSDSVHKGHVPGLNMDYPSRHSQPLSVFNPSVSEASRSGISDSPGTTDSLSWRTNHSSDSIGYVNGDITANSYLGKHVSGVSPGVGSDSKTESGNIEIHVSSPSVSKERKKQGMIISDILDCIDRYLKEQELWAVCRESVLALQRKKKHLPAYISPDTVVIRGDGSITFKAIPEDKPLEVIFMAPELQQKGILSEKTCLYGLGITLRCVAGQKYSTSLTLRVSEEFEKLLLGLLQPSPDKRPTLSDALQICDSHEERGNPPSRSTCQEFFDAAVAVTKNQQTAEAEQSQENRGHQYTTNSQGGLSCEDPSRNSGLSTAPQDDDVVSEEELNLEYVVEDEQDLGYDVDDMRSSTNENGLDDYEEDEDLYDEQPEENSTASHARGFINIHKDDLTSPPGSAFKPLASSSVQTDLSGSSQRLPSAFSSPATHFKPIVLHDASKDDVPSATTNSVHNESKDQEKDVMKKLKELQNELSKHRKSGKDLETRDAERRAEDTKESVAQDNNPPNPLESLLKQLQAQGQMPNTQSLASAIADHLRNQTGQNHPPAAAAEVHSSPPQVPYGQSINPNMSSNVMPQIFPTFQPSIQTYPVPTHPPVLEPSVSFPVQYGSNMYPSYPASVQMQLQQDPRTGMMSWVPVVPYPSSHGSLALRSSFPLTISPEHLRGSRPHSQHSNESTSHNHLIDQDESPKTEDLSLSFRSQGHSSTSSHKSTRGDNSQHKSAKQHSPTAHIIDDDAFRRARSEHHLTSSPIHHKDISSLQQPSNHDLHGHLLNDSRSSPHLRHFQNAMQPLSVPGDQSNSQLASSPQQLSNKKTATHHDISNASQTSSPSPSKDSGVSGVQGAPRSYPYTNTDASLMDRLLSSENIHRQRVQGHVLQLIRQEQGFDMLCEQNTEDCAMAEYITSLANLKWETFVSAITEKYSDLYWGKELMQKLYNIINSHPGEKQASEKSHAPPTPPARYSSYMATESLREQREGRRDRNDLPTRQFSEPGPGTYRHDNRSTYLHKSASSVTPKDSIPNDRPDNDGLYVRKPALLPNRPHIMKHSSVSPKSSNSSDQRPQSACQPFIRSSVISETSDSTDTEMREKKRRYKKRYELDKTKSSSMHNLSSSAVLSVPHRSDSYVIDIPISGNNFHPREMTQDNIKTSHNSEFSNYSNPGSRKFENVRYNRNVSPAYSDRMDMREKVTDIRHRGSIQERYVDNSVKPSMRNTHSKSVTPVNSDYSQFPRNSDTKFNSLPRDMYKHQTSAPPSSYSLPNYTQSHQPVLDRKQEISHRTTTNHDSSNKTLPNSSSGEIISKYSADSDSETNFRNNVRKASAKIMQQSNERRGTGVTGSACRGNGSVKDKVSQAKQNKLSESGSRSLSTSAVPSLNKSESVAPSSSPAQVYVKTGQVVYHWAATQLNMSPEIEAFMQEIEQEEEKKEVLEERLTAVNQQLMVQKKEKRSSQKFYKKLTEPTFKTEKGVEQKCSQVLKNLSEMSKKIRFLELCKTHLQMLITELYGLDSSYLYSLLVSPENKPLVLQPYTENPSVQFQPVREPRSGCEMQVLHAGDPKGLMAFLFASSALSDGYIHQFLYTYRYFQTPEQVFEFIRGRYIAAARASSSDSNILRVRHRAVDLLHFWIEGFYSIDFDRNFSLVQRLEAFIREQVNSIDPEGANSLRQLLEACKHSARSELRGENIGDTENGERGECFVHLETSKKWDSFRSGSKVRITPKHRPSLPDLSVDIDKYRMARSVTDMNIPSPVTRRADAFSMLDHSPSDLVEQLTLVEQDLFFMTHPVHYLNSKAQGVGVSLSLPGMRTPSMQRKNPEPEAASLFVSDSKIDSMVQRIISYNQEVAHWVAAEIVTCTSAKSQIIIMNKFVLVAQLCAQIRNFATCLAVLEGLENLIVRQLPAWKNLPSKCGDIMADLDTIKVQVKGDQSHLMKDKDSHICPTIPSVLYFLLHVQQLEIGSFSLANGMIKWAKMRSVSQMIDQIRIFRENEYLFEPNESLQDTLSHRILEFSDQDLHAIASTNDTNFRKITSGGLTGVFKKVKDKLQSKSEK